VVIFSLIIEYYYAVSLPSLSLSLSLSLSTPPNFFHLKVMVLGFIWIQFPNRAQSYIMFWHTHTHTLSLSLSLSTPPKFFHLKVMVLGFIWIQFPNPAQSYIMFWHIHTHTLSLSLSLSLAAAGIDQVGLGNQVTTTTAAALQKSNLSFLARQGYLCLDSF
jgi:hypothetical protein